MALVVDGAGSMHGVTHTIERIREHGVPGWEVEVVGTDSRVDRRLPAVAEVEVPFYAGMSIGVPSVPELVQTLVDGRYDLIHLSSPGPAGIGAALTARISGTPLVGSYHTELAAYAGVRSGDPRLEQGVRTGAVALLRAVRGGALAEPGDRRDAPGSRDRGGPDRPVGARCRHRALRPGAPQPRRLPRRGQGSVRGPADQGEGRGPARRELPGARERDPRLHLLLAGGGPEEELLRVRLGEHATFLGWLDREQLADAYASSDVFLFCSRTDTYGQVIAEAQASGLPVVAVNEGGPATLIRDGQTGWLCEPNPEEVAAAVAQLAASSFMRARIARQALAEVRGRTWDLALAQLAAGYQSAIGRSRRKPQPRPLQEVA